MVCALRLYSLREAEDLQGSDVFERVSSADDTVCVLSLLHLVLSVQKLLSSVDWNLIQADSMVAGPDRETGGERVSV